MDTYYIVIAAVAGAVSGVVTSALRHRREARREEEPAPSPSPNSLPSRNSGSTENVLEDALLEHLAIGKIERWMRDRSAESTRYYPGPIKVGLTIDTCGKYLSHTDDNLHKVVITLGQHAEDKSKWRS